MYDEYVDRVGDIVTASCSRAISATPWSNLGRVEALLPKSEQVDSERYEHGARVKAIIIKVQNSTKGRR